MKISTYQHDLDIVVGILPKLVKLYIHGNKNCASRLGVFLSTMSHRKEFQTNYISKSAIQAKPQNRCREHAMGITLVAKMLLDACVSLEVDSSDPTQIDSFIKRHAFQNHTTRKENRKLVKIYKQNPGVSWIQAYELANIVLYEGRGSGRGRRKSTYKHIPYTKLKKYPLG